MFLLVFGSCLIAAIQAAIIGDSDVTTKALVSPLSKGSCQFDGAFYPSQALIPRDHPCHYCLCVNGRVDCYWKRCAPAPDGCTVLAYPGVCNPSLYLCSIPEKARAAPTPKPQFRPNLGPFGSNQRVPERPNNNNNPRASQQRQYRGNQNQRSYEETDYESSTFDTFDGRYERDFQEDERTLGFGRRLQRRTRPRRSPLPDALLSRRLPVEEPFPVTFDEEFVRQLVESIRPRTSRSINGTAPISNNAFGLPPDRGCDILGVHYKLGEVVGVATDVCLECRCAAQSLYCSPKCCFEPAPPILPSNPEGRSRTEAPQLPHPLFYVRSEFADAERD